MGSAPTEWLKILGLLAITALLSLDTLLVEHRGELLHRLTLPSRNLDRTLLMLRRQICSRLVAFDRLRRHLAFELCRKLSPRPASSSWFVLCIGEST